MRGSKINQLLHILVNAVPKNRKHLSYLLVVLSSFILSRATFEALGNQSRISQIQSLLVLIESYLVFIFITYIYFKKTIIHKAKTFLLLAFLGSAVNGQHTASLFLIVVGIVFYFDNTRVQNKQISGIIQLHKDHSPLQLTALLIDIQGTTIIQQSRQFHVPGLFFKDKKHRYLTCERTKDPFTLELRTGEQNKGGLTYLLRVMRLEINQHSEVHPSRKQVHVLPPIYNQSPADAYYDNFKNLFLSIQDDEKHGKSIVEVILECPSVSLAVVDISDQLGLYHTYEFYIYSILEKQPSLSLDQLFSEYQDVLMLLDRGIPLDLTSLDRKLRSRFACVSPDESTREDNTLAIEKVLLDWNLFHSRYNTNDQAYTMELSQTELSFISDLILPFTLTKPELVRINNKKMHRQDFSQLRAYTRNYLHVGSNTGFFTMSSHFGDFSSVAIITEKMDFVEEYEHWNKTDTIAVYDLSTVKIPLMTIFLSDPEFCKKFLFIYLSHIKKDSRYYLPESISMSIQNLKYELDGQLLEDIHISDLINPQIASLNDEEFYQVVKIVFEDVLSHPSFSKANETSDIFNPQNCKNEIFNINGGNVNESSDDTSKTNLTSVFRIGGYSAIEKQIFVLCMVLLQEFGYFSSVQSRLPLIISIDHHSELDEFIEEFSNTENGTNLSFDGCFLRKETISNSRFAAIFDTISYDGLISNSIFTSIFNIAPIYNKSGLIFKQADSPAAFLSLTSRGHLDVENTTETTSNHQPSTLDENSTHIPKVPVMEVNS